MLGDFAVGAGLTVGILAGVAAIAVAYDKLTESTRKAREEQDKLIKSLESAIHLKGLGPGGETVDQVKAARDRAAALKTQITTLEAMIVKDAQDADVIASNLVLQQKINALYTERQNLLNAEAGGQSIVNEKVNEAIKANTEKTKEMTFGFMELRNAAERVNAEILKERTDWWKNYIEKTNEALTLTEELQRSINAARPSVLEAFQSMVAAPVPVVDISDSVKIASDQAKEINDAAKNNAQMLRDTIANTAAQTAQIIGNALISFGNMSKQAQVGGALGAGIGGGIGGLIAHELTTKGGAYIGGLAGAGIGSVIPVVGTLIGGFIGSAIGGLFGGHKKEVSANTQALRANTAVLSQVLNSPHGFKVASYRYDATDVQAMGSAARRYAARGGKNPLLVGT